MSQLEDLTDGQLRAKLVQYGLPVMPITASTRRTMIRKLKALTDEKRHSIRRYSDNYNTMENRRILHDDDSDAEESFSNGYSEHEDFDRHLEDDDEDSLDISMRDTSTSDVDAIGGSPPRQFTASFRRTPCRPVPIVASIPTPYLHNFAKRTPPAPRRHVENFTTRTHAQLRRHWTTACAWLVRRTSMTSIRVVLPSVGSGGRLVSLALPIAVAAFFVLLLALYCRLHHGSVDIRAMPICDANTCLSRAHAHDAHELYAILRPQLEARALAHQCGAAPSVATLTSYMTDDDIVAYVMRTYTLQNVDEIRADIQRMALLVQQTAHMTDVVILRLPADDDAIVSAERQQMAQYKRAFAVIAPHLPWMCALRMRVRLLLHYAIWLLTSLVCVIVVYVIAQRVRAHRQRKRLAVMQLVERIIDATQTNAAHGELEYMVVNHVRDIILPVHERKQMEGAWRAAVHFVNAHESRLRTEVQVVRGESCDVWRWVGVAQAWQGRAFEQHAGGVNAPPCSPTACLKVRGMMGVDGGGGDVRDALLAKCGADCRILHVGVDAHAKCVYVKCADTIDAAVAYRQLHGQWYAGHLVTVKYLRLERYMQRFPDSAQRGPPYLRPADASPM